MKKAEARKARLIAIAVLALILRTVSTAGAQTVAGDWQGTLKAGGASLRIAVHIAADPDGKLSGTLDSLDQGARGIRLGVITVSDRQVTFTVPAVAGSFEGQLSGDGSTIDGSWTQGASLPLVLTRGEPAPATPRRPQTPSKPYPYREEDISFVNPAAGISLAGTLTIPPGAGPFPAVMLITGSGAQDRNESLVDHQPFLVLADHLTRKGIVVLRADDRGVGKSGGNFAAATTTDFASDVEAGVAFLRSRREVDERRLGLIGHSEGGMIAPMVANRNPAVHFLVLMAGPGVPGDEIIVEQARLISLASGMAPEAVQRGVDQQRSVLEIVKREKDTSALEAALRERMTALGLQPGMIDLQLKALTTPWYRYFVSYDPRPALAALTCPVLVINGEKDLQVPPAQNLPAIRRALASNTSAQVEEIGGVNHLFQTAKTGMPAEYATIEETIAPAVLDRISNWILGVRQD
jgi:pimeloyl-ACP methyl ester carboxylesterase